MLRSRTTVRFLNSKSNGESHLTSEVYEKGQSKCFECEHFRFVTLTRPSILLHLVLTREQAHQPQGTLMPLTVNYLTVERMDTPIEILY